MLVREIPPDVRSSREVPVPALFPVHVAGREGGASLPGAPASSPGEVVVPPSSSTVVVTGLAQPQAAHAATRRKWRVEATMKLGYHVPRVLPGAGEVGGAFDTA